MDDDDTDEVDDNAVAAAFAGDVVANKPINKNIKNVGSLWHVVIVVAMFVASVDFVCKESMMILVFR